MSCTVTILNVIGQSIPNTQTIDTITVSGDATGCNAVAVAIHCTGDGFAEHTNVPVTNGQWQTTFNSQEIKVAGCLECENDKFPITVDAKCTDPVDPSQSCFDHQVFENIRCKTACCPTISVTANVGECESPGLRNVTFQVTTMPDPNCPMVFAQLDFGDGSLGAGFTVPPNSTYTESHAYATSAMPYNAKVHIISPTNCPDPQISIGPLADCPCPTVTLSDPTVNGCNVNITATVSPAFSGCTLKWQFDDNTNIQIPITTNTSTFSNSQSHNYASGGAHSVAVTVVCGPCAVSATKAYDLTNCGGTPPPPPPPDGEGWGCFALRFIMTVSAILAIAIAALAACIGGHPAVVLLAIAAGIAAAAVIAGVVWNFLCPKPCAWLLLLAWQASIGAGAILLCFTSCCSTFWVIAPLLIASGIGLMFWWKSRCKKSYCDVLKELVIALSGVVLPFLGWVGGIPILSGCINHVVTGILTTIAGLIAAAAAHC